MLILFDNRFFFYPTLYLLILPIIKRDKYLNHVVTMWLARFPHHLLLNRSHRFVHCPSLSLCLWRFGNRPVLSWAVENQIISHCLSFAGLSPPVLRHFQTSSLSYCQPFSLTHLHFFLFRSFAASVLYCLLIISSSCCVYYGWSRQACRNQAATL